MSKEFSLKQSLYGEEKFKKVIIMLIEQKTDTNGQKENIDDLLFDTFSFNHPN